MPDSTEESQKAHPSQIRPHRLAWAGEYARLPTHEQRAIVYRMLAERSRRAARRAGRPDPILLEVTVKPLEGGGYELVSTEPLRSEWGGDGRTVENTKGERPRVTDTPELRWAVEKIKAQLAERADPIETLRAIVPKPRRRA